MKTILCALLCLAQAETVRPVPPPGVPVPEADRAELEKGLAELGKETESLRGHARWADVEIYHKAVRYALHHNEFFDAKEIPVAKKFIAQGLERAKALKEGKAEYGQKGLVALGYVSKIDGSVQPYGLVVPESWLTGDKKSRLDFWFHGRGEKLSELSFIDQRQKSPGEFVPPHTFVLHLYGRYCCANKLAGEVDLFEALEDVKKRYPIDEDRLVVRGFSMGGAACWQFAVHYAGLWCAAAPGAGFSETPDFLKVFQKETVQPTDYEKKLWHLYDCTDYAANLFNLPTVAYSGEIDIQKQAADIMARAMKEEGLDLVHIIGPKTAHKYEPGAKAEINRRIDEIAAKGRDPMPKKIRFTTWTLRYNTLKWVTVDALEEHWARARVEAEIDGDAVKATTSNVAGLTIDAPVKRVILDGQELSGKQFKKVGGKWAAGTLDGLRKRHGLQGPIDDAFMDSFVMVRPTGKARHEKAGAWVAAEMAHAIDHWRNQFRGDARVIDDTAVGDAESAAHNLVLWGDPSSNKVLARIADKLPVMDKGSETRVPALIYPNPLNPKRYVVVNSGFTFREYDYLNNARQVPKLPDWAVYDITVPPTPRAAAKVESAGFFDEQWRLK
jgi:hypothetical protein